VVTRHTPVIVGPAAEKKLTPRANYHTRAVGAVIESDTVQKKIPPYKHPYDEAHRSERGDFFMSPKKSRRPP
jgi:hypothetical protein